MDFFNVLELQLQVSFLFCPLEKLLSDYFQCVEKRLRFIEFHFIKQKISEVYEVTSYY